MRDELVLQPFGFLECRDILQHHQRASLCLKRSLPSSSAAVRTSEITPRSRVTALKRIGSVVPSAWRMTSWWCRTAVAGAQRAHALPARRRASGLPIRHARTRVPMRRRNRPSAHLRTNGAPHTPPPRGSPAPAAHPTRARDRPRSAIRSTTACKQRAPSPPPPRARCRSASSRRASVTSCQATTAPVAARRHSPDGCRDHPPRQSHQAGGAAKR